MLSHSRYDWCIPGDKKATLNETLDWISDFLDSNITIVQKIQKSYTNTKVTRYSIIPYLQIPSAYFIKRKYSKEILIKHQVGNHNKLNRAVVPIFASDGSYVGWTGRSVYEQCVLCQGYHDSDNGCQHYSKWHHKFQRTNHLYNLNNASRFIQESKVAIIVESPGNLWRLEEAGIYNGIGLLGCDLTCNQHNLILNSGAVAIIILMDPDKAGQEAAKTIKEQLISTLFVQNHRPLQDIGEMSKEEIGGDIVNLIQKTENLFK